MTSSFVVCFLLLQFLSSSSSLPFHFAIENENSPNFSGDGEIDGASSNSMMNSLRWIGSLRAVAKNWIVRSGVTSSDPAAAAAQGEHQEAERAGTTGGAAVVHRLWSFEPASCWKTVLQTSGLIKERLNEKIFFLERLFHRVASFFSNFFFGHESKRHLQVELLHAVQLQKKEKKQQQHAAVVHDDFMIKHLQQDGRIISHDHHVPAGPACTTLRQKLASIVTKIVLEGMMESTHKTQSIHALKKNLKYMVGDLMELEIVKQLCDVPQAGSDSMSSSSSFSSPCEQKFCDVFLSDPKTGILMAFSALKINPVKAAMDPQAVVNSLGTPPSPLHYHNYFHKRRVPSQADRKWLFKLAQTKKQLSHIIIQGVERLITKQNIVEAQKHASLSSSSATSAKHNRNFLNYLFTVARSFDGELNPCKACLRQEIFRWKRLTPKVLAVTCSSESSATHPSLTAACEFVKENKLVATTMFAYNLKIWERAAEACKSRVLNSCDFPRGLFRDHQQLLKQQQQQPVHHTRGGGKTTTTTHQQQQQHSITMQVHNRNNTGRAPGVLHHVLQPHTKALNSLTTESVIKLATATEMLSWHDEHAREQPGTPSPQMHKLVFIRSIRYHHQHHPAITNCASSELASFPEGTATAAGSGSGVSLKDQFLLLGDLFKQQEQQAVEAVRSSVAKFLPKGGNKTLRIVGKFSRNFELVRKHRDSSQFDTTVL
jgi:hypothetical protein